MFKTTNVTDDEVHIRGAKSSKNRVKKRWKSTSSHVTPLHHRKNVQGNVAPMYLKKDGLKSIMNIGRRTERIRESFYCNEFKG